MSFDKQERITWASRVSGQSHFNNSVKDKMRSQEKTYSFEIVDDTTKHTKTYMGVPEGAKEEVLRILEESGNMTPAAEAVLDMNCAGTWVKESE